MILRTRIILECVRTGSINRELVNHFAQICIICRHIARNGYSRLPPESFEWIEAELAALAQDFDSTAVWRAVSDMFIDGLTDIVNEYDRMLGSVRLEVFANASGYLDRLMSAPEEVPL